MLGNWNIWEQGEYTDEDGNTFTRTEMLDNSTDEWDDDYDYDDDCEEDY